MPDEKQLLNQENSTTEDHNAVFKTDVTAPKPDHIENNYIPPTGEGTGKPPTRKR